MFRVENSDRGYWGPGALVRVRHEAEAVVEKEVYFLVTHYRVLPSSALSSLRHVHLHAPSGAVLRNIPREWAHHVWVEERRSTTLVQLTQHAMNAMLATGIACRSVATAAEGM